MIKVAMTDRDVIGRLAHLWNVNISGPYRPRGRQTKDVWTVGIYGYTAIGWMMTLYGLLGERRQAVIRLAIQKWVSAPGFARKVRGSDGKVLPSNCHPDRPLHARQMCRQCYSKAYMKVWRPSRKKVA